MGTVLSFGLCIGGSAIITNIAKTSANEIIISNSLGKTVMDGSEKYIDNNVISVAGISDRSNTPRFGNVIAMARVGLHHPIFGVRHGYVDMYMMSEFPSFAKNHQEVKQWTSDMLSLTFMRIQYPVVNEFSQLIAEYGIVGIILFCIPIIYLLREVIRKRSILKERFDIICILIMFIDQLGCLFSSQFFYTYPISFALLYCAIFDRGECSLVPNR